MDVPSSDEDEEAGEEEEEGGERGREVQQQLQERGEELLQETRNGNEKGMTEVEYKRRRMVIFGCASRRLNRSWQLGDTLHRVGPS